MKNLTIFFLILSFFISSSSISVTTVYSDVADKNIGVSSEEITSIRSFEKQTKQSIADANSLIRSKEFVKAKKHLESVLVSVKEKVFVYENNARVLVSKSKESSAKIYSRAASSLNKIEIQISQSLQRLEALQKEDEAKKLREEAAQYITKGFEYLKTDDLDKAKASFEKAIQISPDDSRKAKDGLARAEKARSRSKPELKQKRQAETKYERIETIVSSARQQLEENELAELIKQGKDSLRENNFEEAKGKFSEALKIRPKNELVMKYLAQTEQAKKDYEKDKVVDKVVAEGRKYLEAAQLNKAESAFGKALRMSPSESKRLQIQSLLSDVDKEKKNIQDRGLQKQADEFISKGVDNINKEQYAQAKVNFERALSIKPDYAEAKEWLVRLETIQKEMSHQKLQGILAEARGYLDNNQFDKAEAKIKEILRVNPSHPEALRYLSALDKAKEGYKNYQQFGKIKEKIDIGMNFLEEEQFVKAESVFKEAVDMSPVDMRQQTIAAIENNVNSFIQEIETRRQVDKYISSGVAYLGNNEFDKAEDAFNCAIRLAPGHKDAKQYLQKLEIARLKYQNIQLLEQIGSSTEKKELKQNNLEKDINQLIEQIKVKIGEEKPVS